MIYGTITTDGLDDLVQDIRRFDDRARNLVPLAERLAGDLWFGNREARLDGLDKDGYPFQPLSPFTPIIHESRRGFPRGPGPPLAPDDDRSRIISGFEVRIDYIDLANIDVVGSWPSMEGFLGYHVTGTRHMPARDPVGITPVGWAAIADGFDAWVNTLSED